MRFTQAQVLGFTWLSKEAMRHWKIVLAPLLGRDGRSASFSLGEILALAALAEATRTLGIAISAITPFAEQFFNLVEEDLAAGRVPGPLCITGGEVKRWRAGPTLGGHTVVAVIDFGPIVDRLHDVFGPTSGHLRTTQFELPF